MKDLAARFLAPSNAARPHGAQQIEGFSPNLGRRVQLFGLCHNSGVTLSEASRSADDQKASE